MRKLLIICPKCNELEDIEITPGCRKDWMFELGRPELEYTCRRCGELFYDEEILAAREKEEEEEDA